MGSLYGLFTQTDTLNPGTEPNSTLGLSKSMPKSKFPKPLRPHSRQKNRFNRRHRQFKFFFGNETVFDGWDFSFISNITSTALMDLQYDHIQTSIKHGSINVSHLAELHLNAPLEAFERWAVEDLPVEDYSDIADENFSIVTLVNASTEYFRVGTMVTVRIDILNGQSVPLLRGGDEVSSWSVCWLICWWVDCLIDLFIG